MTEERPRPQYGEYATPEEQAKAIVGSGVEFVPVAVQHPAPPASPPIGSRPVANQPVANQPPPYAAAPARSRRWDLVLSCALLAYGLVNVISGFSKFADLPTLIAQALGSMGGDDVASTSFTVASGVAINIVNVVLYLVTLIITVLLLRRGKIAFYVPLAAGVLASVVAAVLIVAVIVSDPSLMTSLKSFE